MPRGRGRGYPLLKLKKMEKLLKSSCISLGITIMDNAHKLLTRELVAILQSPDCEFTRRFQRFCHLLEQSFQQEENLMEEISYYDIRAHREQHAALLSALHRTIPRSMDGDYFFARQILTLLPQWFLAHLIKMDATLIKALETAGAQPIAKTLSVVL